MCVVDFDGDYCTVWNERTVTARKAYRCSCCGGPIQPGEKCVYHFSVYDHHPTSERCCLACDRVRQEFTAGHDVEIRPGYIQFALENCIADGDEDSKMWRVALDEIRARAARTREVA
jgi:hypothetical protein